MYGNPLLNEDRFKTDVADVNQIAGQYFNIDGLEIPWAASICSS